MRRFLIVVFSVIAASVSASQTAARSRPDLWVTIRPADSAQPGGAFVGVEKAEMYLGGGWGAILARPAVAGASIAVASFRLRAWKEGDNARVVVSAVLRDDRAPKGETETPISTFTLALGQSREISETEQWGAAHVLVSAGPFPGRP